MRDIFSNSNPHSASLRSGWKKNFRYTIPQTDVFLPSTEGGYKLKERRNGT